MKKKMKPEVWMPFYGQDFERDTKGWSRGDRWSYWAALWAYWCSQCEGLPDDDEDLRRICECEEVGWMRCRGKIFGDKFKLRDGKWHQGRAEELYDEAVDAMIVLRDRAKHAADARWNAQAMHKHDLKHDLKHDVEQSGKQCPENAPSPSPSPTPVQPPEPSPSPPSVSARPRFQRPGIEEVKLEAAKLGLPDSEASKFFGHYEANGWLVGRNPMRNWHAAMRNWKLNYEERRYGNTSPGSQQNPRNIGIARAGISYGEAARLKQQQQALARQVDQAQDKPQSAA